jgi:transglutaminase-like putative cysteine protease
LARTALLALLPAALIATGWRQLELPPEGRELGLVALFGIGVALLPRRSLQIVGAAGACLLTVHLAFGLRPVRGIFSGFANGVVDFYEITIPFRPGDHPRMHGVLLLAVFAFTLTASLAITRRRAVLAAAVTFVGAAWPVTLIRDAPSTARGVLLLLAALILLAALRGPEPRRGAGQAVLVGAGVVLAALIAASTPAVAKGGFLNWEQWEPFTRPVKRVDVYYVWDSDYNGIRFPKRSTTVLTIKAPRAASYWRATTLDSFIDDHWIEQSVTALPISVDDRDALLADPLLPPRAQNPENWMRQEVTVRALRDRHLVGATVPIAFERGAAREYSPGVAHVGQLRRNQEYEVWSWVQQPRPRELADSPADYPAEIADDGEFLTTPVGNVPPFGTPERDEVVRGLARQPFADPRYNELFDVALDVVRGARSPYAAVVALETWFRSGLFAYDESPPVRRNVPPLIAFVTRDRSGYCQHFAGAMALMLRYLGIPARVGAGFTTGRYNAERGEWTVSDTNAHTWVEAWFAGYGWLPFDPTPGRGRGLLSSYTASSLFFDVGGARDALAGINPTVLGIRGLNDQGGGGPDDRVRGLDPAARAAGANRDGSSGDGGVTGSLIGLLLLLATALTAALWALKLLRRRARYLTRDPRRLAGAVRLDLVDFLVDQRLPISASATPHEVGDELERSVGVHGERLAEALAEARYGPEGGAEAAVARARRELRAVRRRIRGRLGLGDRVRGLLSLRSLGLGSG